MEITVEVGATQNVGDYSHVKYKASITTEVPLGDYEETMERLTRECEALIHDRIDDELEAAGLRVKYSSEQLYLVRISRQRECIVICPVGVELPKGEYEHWDYHTLFNNEMRCKKAMEVALDLENRHPGYIIVNAKSEGDLVLIPELPDSETNYDEIPF